MARAVAEKTENKFRGLFFAAPGRRTPLCRVQVLEPNSAMRTMLSLEEVLSSYVQFSTFAASLQAVIGLAFAFISY